VLVKWVMNGPPCRIVDANLALSEIHISGTSIFSKLGELPWRR
jgi:hypothetical protein